jgi:hypothetical protein
MKRGRGTKRQTEEWRLPFELDERTDEEALTAHAGTPLLVEYFRASGAAAVVDETSPKQRARGLSASEMLSSMFVLWAAGGERCEEFAMLREDKALSELLGFELPAPQTARDFFERYHAEDLPLLQQGAAARVPSESASLLGMDRASRRLIAWLQQVRPQREATLDIDAAILECDKRAAQPTYDGRRGYQPVVAYWAEQQIVVADEFRDGNVPAGSGNARVIQRALDALPKGVERIRLRADSALYEQEVLRLCQDRRIEYAISADMSRELRAAILSLPEDAWHVEREESNAVRHWAEVDFTPDDPTYRKDSVAPRYIAIRIVKRQGSLFADGSDRKHFCIVTNREGEGVEILRWHRLKAGTVEHVHDILANELAAESLPSQKFGANAAWFRANVILFNLLAALRSSLPEDFAHARPKRLRFALFNTVGRVIRHARETLLRLVLGPARALFDLARVAVGARALPLPGD